MYLLSILGFSSDKHIIFRVINNFNSAKKQRIQTYFCSKSDDPKALVQKTTTASVENVGLEETNKKKNIEESDNTANKEHQNRGKFRVGIFSHHFFR